jgi:hypothetical protein
MPFKRLVAFIAVFAVGLAAGGYLFAQSTPRSLLSLGDCQDRCYNVNELTGLVTSAAILRAPFLVPGVVLESDTCLAIRHPKPEARVHYVLFPKHDTRNITSLTREDSPYVLGCFAMARELVVRDKLKAYRLQTNGPALQDIAYLHFHLIAH